MTRPVYSLGHGRNFRYDRHSDMTDIWTCCYTKLEASDSWAACASGVDVVVYVDVMEQKCREELRERVRTRVNERERDIT